MTRWLRWVFVCRLGRRCARMVVTHKVYPPDLSLLMTYTCGGCGTQYESDGSGQHRRQKLAS